MKQGVGQALKILVITIGAPRSGPVRELAADYSKRVRRYTPFEMTACRDEGKALSLLKPGDFFVVLDERGGQKTSGELAEFFAAHKMRGTKRIVFFIGGPDGSGEEIFKRANLKLGLSNMTLPHELALVIMTEQIYRAFSILKGEPYHRGG